MTTPARSRDQKSAPIDDLSPDPHSTRWTTSTPRPRGVRLVEPDRRGLEVALEHPQSSHAILIALSSESASVLSRKKGDEGNAEDHHMAGNDADRADARGAGDRCRRAGDQQHARG